MARDCILRVLDQVNVKLEGLDPATRRALSNKVKYFLPHARYTPAYKLGRWDGMVRYCDIAGRTYINILDRLLPIVEEAGYYITLDDQRPTYSFSLGEINENSYSHIVWPKNHVKEGQQIVLHDHQVQCINEYLKNTQGIQKISTGAGKTVITAILSHKIEPYGRSLIIVPNKDLVTQTEKDYKNFGLDVGVYYGDRKELGHKHTICTWQSIEALDKKNKNGFSEVTISDIIDDLVCIIIDEAHAADADVLKRHLSTTFKDVPIRWGMTGTIPKEDYSSLSLICCIGPLVNQVSAKELQDKGVLSDIHIDIFQIDDYCTQFSSYQSELKYLVTDEKRVKFVADIIKNAKKGNTLILVDRITTGQLLQSHIPDSLFINGDTKSDDRKEEYSAMRDDDDRVLIATYGIAAVGIDVPRLFSVFLIEPGKSFIRVIQTIGRGLRKADDKSFVNIFDITSTAKYSKKHLRERKKYYKDEQFPFKLTKIDYNGDA